VAGGLFHVTAHSNVGRILFREDAEREEFLVVFGDLIAGLGWSCRAYCLLSTHYHLLIGTPHPNLSAGMQYLNGRYAQRINRLRGERGHLLEGRYRSVTVTEDGHRLELQRYLAVNPVRASLVARPEQWPWSSYAALLGLSRAPFFLDVDRALFDFAGTREIARRRLHAFVHDGLVSRHEV
jgi:putative transposase